MVRVVMLTAAAGPGLNVQYGDVFETDQATADRLLQLGSARAEEPEDKGRVAKRDMAPQVVPTVATQPETNQQGGELDEADGESDEAGDESDDVPAEPAPAPAPVRRATRRR